MEDETVNANTDPGYPNDLVDLVGELEEPESEKATPKKRTAKKKAK